MIRRLVEDQEIDFRNQELRDLNLGLFTSRKGEDILIELLRTKSEILQDIELEIVATISVMITEKCLDLVDLLARLIIGEDLGESVDPRGDVWKYLEHLLSESIFCILPEEVL